MAPDPDGPRVLSLFEEDAVDLAEGLHWIPLRRRLGIEAFGTNAYRADAGEAVVEEHVESPGQEELYVVIAGRAEFEVGEERFDLGPGEVLFVPDPEQRRGATATADGTAVLAVGGWTDRAYHSLPWEVIYLAAGPFDAGQWAECLELIDREAGPHRDHPYVRYRVAVCMAQLGHLDEAQAELAIATEARPELADRAAKDERLEPLR